AVLVHAVIVAGDGAGTHVHARTDLGVADIGQMVGLRACSQHAFLNFNKIAHVRFRADLGTGSQACVGAKACVVCNGGFVDVRVGLNARAATDTCIAHDAVGADMHAVGKRHLALEHAANVDEDVASASQFTAKIEAFRVGERHAGLQQTAGLFLLPGPL